MFEEQKETILNNMTNSQNLLETWTNLKQTILKKRINAQTEIKFALHELVLTLSSEMSPNLLSHESALKKYQKAPPEEVKRALELEQARNPTNIGNKHIPFKKYYLHPLIQNLHSVHKFTTKVIKTKIKNHSHILC